MSQVQAMLPIELAPNAGPWWIIRNADLNQLTPIVFLGPFTVWAGVSTTVDRMNDRAKNGVSYSLMTRDQIPLNADWSFASGRPQA